MTHTPSLRARRRVSRTKLRDLFYDAQGCCTYCGRPTQMPSMLPGTTHELTATADHRIPVSKGGGNEKQNLTLACLKCNTLKSNMLPAQWTTYMKSHPLWWTFSKRQRRERRVAQPGEPTQRITAPAMSAAETSHWLREQSALSRIEWVWLRKLVTPLVRECGFGPW